MKLRAKTTLGICVIFTVAGLASFGFFNSILLDEYLRFENTQNSTNAARVTEAFEQEIDVLRQWADDWGIWDDSYRFVTDQNPEFVATNLSVESVKTNNFDRILFVNANQEIVYGVKLDRNRERLESQIQGQSLEIDRLVRSPFTKKILESKQSAGGFLTVDGSLSVISASPIRDSGGEKEVNGVVIFMRKLDSALIERIAKQTRLNIRQSSSLPQQPGVDERGKNGNSDVPFFAPIFHATDDVVTGELVGVDVYGAPVLNLELTLPRDIFLRGVAARRLLGTIFAVIGGACAIIVLFFMNRLVLRRLASLSSQLNSIALGASFGGRVRMNGDDELSSLAHRVNETLAALCDALEVARASQKIAEEASDAKTGFIAKVSHELRTPIHSITGMLRILQREERSTSKRNYIMMARNAALGLLETINEILDFSKAEAGKLRIERIEFNLHDVVREAMQTIGPRAEEKGGLEVLVDVEPGLPSAVYGDPHRLQQIIVNLMGNAVKFTKEGVIGLRVKYAMKCADHATLMWTVFDTGVGIPRDRLSSVFEPFTQADDSVTRMYTGTGLGLTIVRQLVEDMGGGISVVSEVGKGSEFTFTIPFDFAGSCSFQTWRPKLTSNRVGLIGSESQSLKLYGEELTGLGYESLMISSSDNAILSRLSQEASQFGLIIVTSEALKRSRVFDLVIELSDAHVVPVVAILSPSEISIRERLLALHVPFVVSRPISLQDVLALVDGSLKFGEDRWEDSEETSLALERPLNVLLADDAPTNRLILTELLREAGHSVVCVENGIEMVNMASDAIRGVPGAPKFDLILTDVQMPLLDGLNATRRIRQLEDTVYGGGRIPIVAVTAHAMTDETSRMSQFGVDDVVTKPLEPVRLAEVIQRVTGMQSTVQSRCPSGPTIVKDDSDIVAVASKIWRQLSGCTDEIRDIFSSAQQPFDVENLGMVLDVADVYHRSGKSIRRTCLIFSAFLDCYKEQIVRLSDARQALDAAKLSSAAHALKGILLDIGSRVPAALASKVETLGREGNLEEARSLSGQLSKQVLSVARLVEQLGASILFKDPRQVAETEEGVSKA